MRILILANNDIGLYKFRKELIEELVKNNEVYMCLPNGEYIKELEKIGGRFIECKLLDRHGTNPIQDLKLMSWYKKIRRENGKPDHFEVTLLSDIVYWYRPTEVRDPVSGYDVGGGSLNRLYSFVDLMANWTSIIVFLFVLLPIAGALINRHTKKIKVQQCRSFIPSAWVCLIIIGLGMAFIIVSSFANIVIVASWAKDIGNNIINSSGNLELYSQDAWNVEMLGAIMTLVVLVVFIFICTIPSVFEVKHENLIAKGNKRAKIK